MRGRQTSYGRGPAAPKAVAALLGLVMLVGGCGPAEPQPDTPSGHPVPRWVSTRSSGVNARAGPGLDYPALWTYQAAGIPLQVVAETREWRKVCDPEGGVAWIHHSRTSGRRMAMAAGGSDVALRSRPSEEAPVAARLGARASAPLGDCEEGWCRVGTDRAGGFAPAVRLFGTADTPHCDALAPSGRRSAR